MEEKKIKKYNLMTETELNKELETLRFSIILARIDIANRKTSGIHKIKLEKKNIARIMTILSRKEKENNEQK